jgi:hypothetical protein
MTRRAVLSASRSAGSCGDDTCRAACNRSGITLLSRCSRLVRPVLAQARCTEAAGSAVATLAALAAWTLVAVARICR